MPAGHALYHEDDVTSPEMVRPVLHIIGILLAVLGVGMLVPALADAAIGHSDWIVFVTSSAITVGAAGALFVRARRRSSRVQSAIRATRSVAN